MNQPTTPQAANQQDSLIEYPSDFPIKVMGLNHPEFVPTMVELVRRHDPQFDHSRLTTRDSAKGTYLSLTVTVRATSREQLDQLYIALSGHPMVKMAL